MLTTTTASSGYKNSLGKRLERAPVHSSRGRWILVPLFSLSVILLLARCSVEDHALIARAAAGCPKTLPSGPGQIPDHILTMPQKEAIALEQYPVTSISTTSTARGSRWRPVHGNRPAVGQVPSSGKAERACACDQRIEHRDHVVSGRAGAAYSHVVDPCAIVGRGRSPCSELNGPLYNRCRPMMARKVWTDGP
jgi:hypothetical protein